MATHVTTFGHLQLVPAITTTVHVRLDHHNRHSHRLLEITTSVMYSLVLTILFGMDKCVHLAYAAHSTLPHGSLLPCLLPPVMILRCVYVQMSLMQTLPRLNYLSFMSNKRHYLHVATSKSENILLCTDLSFM